MRSRPNASVAALFLLSLTLSFQTPARAEDVQADEYEEDSRVARVSLVKGEVTLRRAGADEWERARPNLPLVEGDELATGRDSRAEVQLDARNFVRLGPDTILKLTTLREEGVAFSLSEGAATFRLARFDRGREYFEVDAPKTTVAAERPGLYRLDVGADGRVRVTVRGEGRARVYSETSGFVVRAGRTAYLTYDGYGEGDWELSAAPSDDWWDQWVDERERHLAARLRFDGRDRYYDPEVWGAEELDLYGDWSHTREYGYVWRPHVTVVNNYYNWAPYRHGHWSWVGPYGWTWVPDEDWGWAPYHYGRWVYLNNSWCWAPRGYGYHYRRARWRPALVAFVNINVSRGHHIAWYPLTYGQRDPRGRFWRRGYDRLSPLRAGDAAGLTRANPALLRAVTTQPAHEFGAAGVRARPALNSDVARSALTAEPLTGSPPVVPARAAGGRTEARAPRAGVTRGRTEANDGRGGLVIVRPESVQPPRAAPSRTTGAAERAPGVALDERLRRTRVFNNREPRVVSSAPEAGTNPGADAGMGAVTRPARAPRRLPTESPAGPETDGGQPGVRVRRPRPDADDNAGRGAGAGPESGSESGAGGGESGSRPATRPRRPERVTPDGEPIQPRVRRPRPEAERPNTESPEPSTPRVSPPSESVERPQPPTPRAAPRPPRVEPRVERPDSDTPRRDSPPHREPPRESPRRDEPAEQPPPRVHAPQTPKQERPAPPSRSGESPPRTAPRARPAERPQREQLENED